MSDTADRMVTIPEKSDPPVFSLPVTDQLFTLPKADIGSPLHSRSNEQQNIDRTDCCKRNSREPGSATVVTSRSGTGRLRLLTGSTAPAIGRPRADVGAARDVALVTGVPDRPTSGEQPRRVPPSGSSSRSSPTSSMPSSSRCWHSPQLPLSGTREQRRDVLTTSDATEPEPLLAGRAGPLWAVVAFVGDQRTRIRTSSYLSSHVSWLTKRPDCGTMTGRF
jgi:hypothetical protein